MPKRNVDVGGTETTLDSASGDGGTLDGRSAPASPLISSSSGNTLVSSSGDIAQGTGSSRGPQPFIMSFRGKTPVIGEEVWIAPNATVIGDVELDEEASVWFGAVLRGDIGPIRIGARTNVQDLACIHLTEGLSKAIIGADVTIGHGAILHGCRVGHRCLIGMGAILLDNAVIGDGSVIAAGTLVPPRMVIPPGSFVRGSPAKVVRPVTAEEAAMGPLGAEHYRLGARRFREELSR